MTGALTGQEGDAGNSLGLRASGRSWKQVTVGTGCQGAPGKGSLAPLRHPHKDHPSCDKSRSYGNQRGAGARNILCAYRRPKIAPLNQNSPQDSHQSPGRTVPGRARARPESHGRADLAGCRVATRATSPPCRGGGRFSEMEKTRKTSDGTMLFCAAGPVPAWLHFYQLPLGGEPTPLDSPATAGCQATSTGECPNLAVLPSPCPCARDPSAGRPRGQ